jgi:hypothetical protein
MRRRSFLLALLAPLPALAAPPRPADIAAPAPTEEVRVRRPRLGRGIYGGRRTHWSRNYTTLGRPRGGRHF